ncbi:hypothetical protein VNN41_05640 [Lactococcus garvieae]|uniref:hypothetical protein n=1 Tax=Lactococcus garvieae TaxID=1363 RepID=UPI0032538B01
MLFAGSCFLGALLISTGEIKAAVKIESSEEVKIERSENMEAIKKAEKDGVDFSKSPVKPGNLTTQNLVDSQKSEIILQDKIAQLIASGKTRKEAIRALSVVYDMDRLYHSGLQEEIQNNWLVPLNFVALENGIPKESVWYQISSSYAKFYFDPNYVTDLGYGGAGDGGYYWRRFRIRVDGIPYYPYKDIWLSAYDKNHLIYGIH